MKLKNYVLIGLIILVSGLVKAQEAVLCALQKDEIKIVLIADIPSVTNNTDGTITLTHQDQNITDIFAHYTLYDFYQTFPSSNPEGELIKYYTIVHGNRALINELYDYVDSNMYIMEPYTNTTISSEVVDLLDNKSFKLIKYCTESTEGGLPCPEGEQNVPEDFELKIAFEYDAVNDVILAETVGVSSCGYSFSINMKGGFDDGFGSTDNTLQLWQSVDGNSVVTDFSQPCSTIENMLYSVLSIGCQEGSHYGNIRVNVDTDESGNFILRRENAIFATDFLTFQDEALSIEEEIFQLIKPFQIEGNPYLQIANLNNQSIFVEILNTSGQQVLKPELFQQNSLNISTFSSGLYFIRVSNINNQQKIFKFLIN